MICELVRVITPKEFALNGLYFGSRNANRCIICIHGLTGSMFSGQKRWLPLLNKNTSVLVFNNRGAETISRVTKIDKRDVDREKSFRIGGAIENFTDCVDDIEGAVQFVEKIGIKNIYLYGHSTGCQKSVYYLSKTKKQDRIKGLIMSSPMSDYAENRKDKDIEKVTKYVTGMIKNGDGDKIIPYTVFKYAMSAKRYMSLYTPDSKEEIFCYCQKGKKPKTLHKIKIPVCVVLGKNDEHRDRPIKEIAKWFDKNIKSNYKTINVVEKANHKFCNRENDLVKIIQEFIKNV